MIQFNINMKSASFFNIQFLKPLSSSQFFTEQRPNLLRASFGLFSNICANKEAKCSYLVLKTPKKNIQNREWHNVQLWIHKEAETCKYSHYKSTHKLVPPSLASFNKYALLFLISVSKLLSTSMTFQFTNQSFQNLQISSQSMINLLRYSMTSIQHGRLVDILVAMATRRRTNFPTIHDTFRRLDDTLFWKVWRTWRKCLRQGISEKKL